MGNKASTLRFDCSRCSKGVFVTTVVCGLFTAQMTNNLVFLQKNFADPHVKKRQLKFKIVFGDRAEPVIGISHSDPDFDDLWIEDNPNISYWDLKRGRLFVRGEEAFDIHIPRVKTEATVKIEFEPENLLIVVENPREDMRKIQVVNTFIHEYDFDNIFLGAIQTGKKQIEYTLLSETAANNKLPENKEAFFDFSQGVINVSKDGMTMTRTGSQQGNGYALLNKLLKKGTHRIKFCINSDFGASLCIGVARYPFRLSDEYVKDVMKHIYRHPGLILWRSYRGLLYSDGKQLEQTTEALGWQHGMAIYIELVVDMERRTIEIYKNDNYFGVIFNDIPEVVQPVVCFYASYEKSVKLVSYQCTEPTVLPSLQAATLPSLDSIPKKAPFDIGTKMGLMTISSDKMTVSREKNQSGNSLCFLSVTCVKNVHYRFSFVVENDQGASVCVGVTEKMNSRDIRITGIGNIYSSPHLYLFRSFQGMLYEKGKELPKHLEEFWMTGTLLEMNVIVEENSATVQYAINGNDQGIAFSGLRPPLKPLVAFYAGMEKRVTLIHFEATPKRSVVNADSPSNRFSRLVSLPTPETPHATSLPSNPSDKYADVSSYTTEKYPASLTSIKLLQDFKKPIQAQKCRVCQKPVDCITVPCDHMYLCTEHLIEHIESKKPCPCGKPIVSMWNVF